MASEAKSVSVRRRLLIAAAALLLTGAFMYIRFPYERLIPGAESAFEKATGLPLRIGELSAWPTPLGPGIAARSLRLEFPEGARLDLRAVRIRPAWSLSWLSGEASIVLEFEDDLLAGESLLGLGEVPSLSGRLLDIDLSMLPPRLLGKGVALEGFSDLDFEVQLGESGAEGQLRIAAKQGSLEHPQFPIALPFDSIEGQIELGGDDWLIVHSLSVDSPLLTGGLAGSVGPPPGSELNLQGEFQTQREVRSALQSGGFKLNRSGTLYLAIGGSAARPVLR